MIKKLFILFISFSFLGCATISSDSIYPVSINSSPEGARFEITNESGMKIHSGRTPAMVTLNAAAGFFDGALYRVKFTKDGFEERSATIDSQIDGWYFANLLFGGIIGFLIIDPATGAMYKLPKFLSVSLSEKLPKSSGMDRQLKILSINDIPSIYRNKLIPIN